MSRKATRIVVALTLLAALFTAPAAAWGGRDRHEGRFDTSLRTWMVRVLERVRERVVGVWEQAGSVLDPDG